MNKTLSTNVTPEQYAIIKKIAEENKCSVSNIVKESISMRIFLQKLNEVISKSGIVEKGMESIKQNMEIAEHARAMAILMKNDIEKTLSDISPESMKVLEQEGKTLEKMLKVYGKTKKLGRPAGSHSEIRSIKV